MNAEKLADRPLGDKRREERRVAIIDAAEALFLEKGYDNTTLAAVVQRSGGSLATLYEHYGNKQGLLRAVVTRVKSNKQFPIPGTTTQDKSCSAQLRVYARDLFHYLTTTRIIALNRIVITEAMRDPSFARDIYHDFHLAAVDELAQTFRKWTDNGCAQIDDPHAAADLFFAMTVDDNQMRIMCMTDEVFLSDDELDWRLAPFLTHFKVK